jgi:hypothetical protein
MLKNNAQVAAVEGNRLVLSFGSVGARRYFTQNGVDILVQEALREVIGADFQVVAGDDSGAAAAAAAAEPRPPVADMPPGVDLDDEPADEQQPGRRPAEDEALDLVQRDLGATVIGEIDAS